MSYVIRHIAANNNHGLVHVPINTKIVDLDFIVDRLLSILENINEENTKIVYHINVSSDAGMQVIVSIKIFKKNQVEVHLMQIQNMHFWWNHHLNYPLH